MEDSNNNLENNHQDKKKMIMAIVIGAVTLLIAITGATYAYFQVSTENNNTNSNVTVKTGKPGTATLKPGIGDLHIILNNVDMSESNSGNEYYADDTKNYVDNETEGTHTISSVEITDGDSDISYKCTADIEVNLTTDAGSMGEAIKSGDVLLNIEGQEIDLFDVKTSNPTTVNLSFRISGNNTKEIQAYAKLINKNQPQNYLTDEDGKQLEIKLTSKNLDCDMYEPDPKIAFLRSKDTNETLSKDIVGDMYRYQGTDNVNNYICFGTTENCGANEELIDKYMYRIIGITEEGQMKLIKETVITEGDNDKFKWTNCDYENESADEECNWANSTLLKRLNGTADTSDGTNIFVNNSKYDYMVEENPWYNAIENHNWKYGDLSYELVNSPGRGEKFYDEENNFQKTIKAKISLMYIYDYLFSSDSNIENNYLYPNTKTGMWEWTMTRQGFHENAIYESDYWYVSTLPIDFVYGSDNFKYVGQSDREHGVRPTFYLLSDVKIKNNGEGTKENPYILDVQE